MAAGKLDRRITLAARDEGQDDYGQPVAGFTDYATVWASYEPVSDGERSRADQTAAIAVARFKARYRASLAVVKPTDRLTFDGTTYEVIGVKEIGRRRYLEITAGAEVSDGKASG